MGMNNPIGKCISLTIIALMLMQCQSAGPSSGAATNETPYLLTGVDPSTPTNSSLHQLTETSLPPDQVGCILPPVQISDQNVRYFHWSENSQMIIYQGTDTQVWYGYNILSGQINPIQTGILPTPDFDLSTFELNDYIDAFVSPSREMILFTRGIPEKYGVYYKFANEKKEYHLGTIHGYIKKVDWFNNEKSALVAMNWQAAIYPEAPLYRIDFSKNELMIEMPNMSDYKNIEYLGLTPDETRFLFVSFLNKVHLDRTVKIWNILTHEITSAPIFNPLDLRWVSENEFISIGQDPDISSVVSVLLYDIDNSKLTNLADAKFSIDPFITNAIQISPNGSSVAYIENNTDNLYWTACRH
jgi:hypothetical protein